MYSIKSSPEGTLGKRMRKQAKPELNFEFKTSWLPP